MDAAGGFFEKMFSEAKQLASEPLETFAKFWWCVCFMEIGLKKAYKVLLDDFVRFFS